MTRLIGLMVLMGSGILVLEASAQQAREVPKGPSEKDSFAFSVDLIGQMSDNRDDTEIKDSNFDFYLRPRIDVAPRWDETSLDFCYAPSWRYRSNPSESQNETELFHDLAVKILHQPSNIMQLRLNDYFNVTDDPSIQKNGATLRRDCSYTRNSADAGVSYKPAARTQLDASVRNTTKRYKVSEFADQSDEDMTGANLALWRQVQRTTGILAAGDIGTYKYEHFSGVVRDVTIASGALGIEHDFRQDLRGSARIGYQSAAYKDETIGEESGLLASASLGGDLSPGLRLKASVVRGIRDSAVYPYSSQKSTELQGSVEWDVSPQKITIGLSCAYQMSDYDVETVPQGTRNDPAYSYLKSGDQKAVVASAEVTYRVDGETSVKLVQQYEDLSSDVRESYTRNATSLALSRRF